MNRNTSIGQSIDRRSFVVSSGMALTTSWLLQKSGFTIDSPVSLSRGINFSSTVGDFHESRPSPTHSIEPVIGDGKWISRKPPEKATGNYESRTFEVEIGIEAMGTGNTPQFIGTTVVPVELPEQKIEALKIEKNGFAADIQELTNDVARLVVGGSLIKGQTCSATAKYRLVISKSYHGYSTENLLADVRFPTRQFGQWLGNSPGIQTHSNEVSKAAQKLSKGIKHPLDKVKKFQDWVFEHIKGRPMKYTSVTDAIKNGVGDCEERAGTLVALCRSIGIPARLVWVPNHVWAECCLYDKEQRPRWIPVHTAAYNWFGWTGAHELVLQKGDRIQLPNNRKKVRLVSDWLSWKGAKPKVRFTGTVRPLAADQSTDAGPGHRVKDAAGRWNLNATHPDNKYLRR